jgi:hypothetical protein
MGGADLMTDYLINILGFPADLGQECVPGAPSQFDAGEYLEGRCYLFF